MFLPMSKSVISFRLSESELQILDEACHRFNESRSQVVSRAIKSLLTEYVDRDGKLIRQPYWMPNMDGKYNAS
jgi:metal-responsive CopG/Arc/MetJ family transcriptional regulator